MKESKEKVMNKCTNNCNNCNSSCCASCPICNMKGKSVPLITLKHKIIKNRELIMDEKSYICINRNCDVVYFQETNPKYFLKDEIEDEVWFKTKGENQIICYCHKILLKDIVNIVKASNQEALTKTKILELLKVDGNHDCIKHNPVGESCDRLFQNAIIYAYKQKENK